MPFTRAWSITTPPGTIPANQLDDYIRQAKQDIGERLEATLVESMAVDPLVLKSTVSGKKLKTLNIPFTEFKFNEDNGAVIDSAYFNGYARIPESYPAYAGIKLPSGVTIRSYGLLAKRTGLQNIDVDLMAVGIDGSGPTEIVGTTFSSASSSIIFSNLAGLSLITLDTQFYYFRISPIGNPGDQTWLYGMQVTYDTPSHLNTI